MDNDIFMYKVQINSDKFLGCSKKMNSPAEVLQQTNFSVIDWIIIIAYPMISLVIGLVVRRYVKDMNDFVCAGRGLGVCLGVATMTGTELGLITVMYSAQKGFTGGFAAFHIAVAAGITTFIVGSTGFIVYRLREMQVMTIPEFYERRFGRKTRILGGLMMALGGILNMGLFLKVGSMFLVGITGLSEHSLALPVVMVFLLSLVLIYTCLGGMLSIVIADYVQFVVLSFGLLLATLLAIWHLGWTNIFSTVEQLMGPAGFDPTIEGSGFGLDYMIWMGFLGLIGCAVWPTSVARALAMESPAAVKKQYMWASISFMIRFLIPYFWGICALVFVVTQDAELQTLFFPSADALAGGTEPFDNLYAMPIFLGRILPAGIIGIISAGMIAAFMSTHDSYLLCWSSVLTQDVIAPMFDNRLSSKTRILITRVLIVAIGLFVLYWGLLYEGKDDVWDYMAVTGAIYFTGAFALLLGGLYWKKASSTGAVLALLAGSTALLGLGPVQARVGKLLTALSGPSLSETSWLAQLPGVSLVERTSAAEVAMSLSVDISSERVGLISIGMTLGALVLGSLLFPDKNQRESV